jgi:hypothetical protein
VKTEKNRVGFVEPMLAVAVTKLPEGAAWSYELKFDGYRAIGMKAAGQVPREVRGARIRQCCSNDPSLCRRRGPAPAQEESCTAHTTEAKDAAVAIGLKIHDDRKG